MIGAYPSEVVRVVCALLSPFIALFGIYVIAHGHYGPGGGFAGGVFVAAGAILPRLTLDESMVYRLIPAWVGPIAGGLGTLAFLVVGTVPLLAGGAFLDYGAVEVAGAEASRVRYLGILVVEVAVGFAVFGALLTIFDTLAREERDDRPDPTPGAGRARTPAAGADAGPGAVPAASAGGTADEEDRS